MGGCDEVGEEEAPKDPEPGEDAAEVVADGAEDSVGSIAVASLEVITAEMAFRLDVTNDGLDGGAPTHLVSIVTTNARARGGMFVLHAKALPGNPYDGHTLGDVIAQTERPTGREIERACVATRAMSVTMRPTRIGSSGRDRSVASSVPSDT